MKQRITTFVTRRESRTYKDANTFSYRPDGKLPWLQRALFAALKKLGCDNAIYYEPAFSRHEINTQSIIDNIIRQRTYLMDLDHEEIGTVYIGEKEFISLGGEVYGMESIQIQGSYNYHTNGRTQILGLNVVVVPWMEGVFVAPKPRNLN